ncbi:unnamed protein product, partial [Protopolystoma xenopodis]
MSNFDRLIQGQASNGNCRGQLSKAYVNNFKLSLPEASNTPYHPNGHTPDSINGNMSNFAYSLPISATSDIRSSQKESYSKELVRSSKESSSGFMLLSVKHSKVKRENRGQFGVFDNARKNVQLRPTLSSRVNAGFDGDVFAEGLCSSSVYTAEYDDEEDEAYDEDDEEITVDEATLVLDNSPQLNKPLENIDNGCSASAYFTGTYKSAASVNEPMNHLVDSINSGQLNQQGTVTNDQERAALS